MTTDLKQNQTDEHSNLSDKIVGKVGNSEEWQGSTSNIKLFINSLKILELIENS